MAKVLFVIRLPAHENDLKTRCNSSFEEALPDEDRNESCKETRGEDGASNPLQDNKDLLSDKITFSTDKDIGTKSEDEIPVQEKSDEPPWDFGEPNDSESSTALSTAKSSPSKTPTEESNGKKIPTANAAEKNVQSSIGDAQKTQDETTTDSKFDAYDVNLDLGPLNQPGEEKKVNANNKRAISGKMRDEGEEDPEVSKPDYVRFVSREATLLERAKSVLEWLNVTGVQWSLTEDNIHVGMFIAGDGAECEEILNRLSVLRIGILSKSSISIFPANISVASVQEEEQVVQLQATLDREDKLEEKVEEFKKTIKSKLVIQQVITNVEADASFSFDYLMLILLASLVALLGLLEASSVVLVASMLISPLMGPILAGVLGTVIRNMSLLNLGIRSELKGLGICIAVGFMVGLIPAGMEAAQLDWRSSDSWPTIEMSSRGALRALPVGVMIAIPSGAGVALSVLGGKVGSLVGVAISASLLPPAVNAGLLWANALLVAFVPPAAEERMNISKVIGNKTSDETEDRYGYAFATTCPSLVDNAFTQHYFCDMAAESAMLGLVSLLLTLLNILCIIVMGVIVLKIKEVAPLPSAPDVEQEFYGKTLKVARESYQTAKGESSLIMRAQFMQEYRAFKSEIGITNEEMDDIEEGELDQILEDVETSPEVNEFLRRFPIRFNRWSGNWTHGPDSAKQAADRPYKTVNFGKYGGHVANSSDVELRELRRRKSYQTLLSTKLEGDEEDEKDATGGDEKGDSTYFTIHRYIPPGQMRSGLMSPRRISSGPFFPKIAIPKVSRFQIAKVPESEGQKARVTGTSTAMPTISEQETAPLIGNKLDLPV